MRRESETAWPSGRIGSDRAPAAVPSRSGTNAAARSSRRGRGSGRRNRHWSPPRPFFASTWSPFAVPIRHDEPPPAKAGRPGAFGDFERLPRPRCAPARSTKDERVDRPGAPVEPSAQIAARAGQPCHGVAIEHLTSAPLARHWRCAARRRASRWRCGRPGSSRHGALHVKGSRVDEVEHRVCRRRGECDEPFALLAAKWAISASGSIFEARDDLPAIEAGCALPTSRASRTRTVSPSPARVLAGGEPEQAGADDGDIDLLTGFQRSVQRPLPRGAPPDRLERRCC